MGAESIAQADDSPVGQIRKPDKVEALDVALLNMPVKETIGSPDSVLSASLQENVGEVASKLRVESFTFDALTNVNGSDNVDSGTSMPAVASTKEVDRDGDEGASVALQDALLPAAEVKENTSGETHSITNTDDDVESPILIVQSPAAKESIAHEIQEMEEISLEEDGQKEISPPKSQPVSNVSKLAEKFSSIKQIVSVSEEAEGSNKQSSTVLKKGISAPMSQPVINISKLMENFSNIKQSAPLSEEGEGSSKQSTNVLKKGMSATASQPVINISKLMENFSNTKESALVSEGAEGTSEQSTTVLKEDQKIESKPSTADLTVGEGNITEDTMVDKKASAVELQPDTTETPVAELPAKAEVSKAVERTEREEKLAVLAANAIEALPSSRYARASEIQEASEPGTPPTPERSGATVIRLTRQMSRVSTGMGPMSPRFEIRAAKEIQDLQEKVKVMEEELRRKAAVIETQSFNHKEREAELLYKIECLELANEQLLQGGNDSSIQLQMELTRLQRQNSVLQLRERELQFQINTQEMIKTQMLDKRPSYTEPANPIKELESKVAILESKLAEAVEVSNMYKIQLHEAFTRQKSVQSVALLNLGDGEDVLKELQKLRKQTKEQEAELLDLQDRFFITTVRLAESAAQKEELLSKLKRLQGGK
ncbi:hypothetical protein M758_2G161700 [Ceratodon purpureus]|nr:hypothetical protein M758_2G161700 [Ceratodon purpureus]KAG0626922.1 hypothetical protein M758_2G161700 [Ceratodon purpureus]